MAKNKTTENDNSVAAYVSAIAGEKRREDISELITIFAKQTGMEAKMWGVGIVGFGSYHYKYESGHEGDAPLVGLAARTNAIVLYVANFENREEFLKGFGKHKTSKGCIYVQKLEDIDLKVLGKIIINALKYMKAKYPQA